MMTPSPTHAHLLVVGVDEARRREIAARLATHLAGASVAEGRPEELDQLLGDRHFDLLVVDGVRGDVQVCRRLCGVRKGSVSPRPFVLVVCPAEVAATCTEVIADAADDFMVDSFWPEELELRASIGLERARVWRQAMNRAAELEELTARQTDFLSVVSHEIRTPLAAILSAANILVRYGNQRPESVERFARVIQEEGRRLTRLINNLLDLTKIEAGQVEWVMGEVSIGEVAKQVQEAFAALVGERRVELVSHVEHSAPNIIADRDKLMQVLVNLISNAVKHSPEGGRVYVRYLRSEEQVLRIKVEDEGAGIPPGAEERVFQRFQQLDVDDRKRGTGLGLTISRHIVARHGGRIWAEPGRQRGALFVVELPVDGLARSSDGPVR